MSDFDDDDPRWEVALFRAEVIGGLIRRDLPRGALKSGLEKLAEQRFRPPNSDTTRRFAASTLERWYYAYKNGGLEALRPKARSDRGFAQALSDEMRELLLEIRRQHPAASVPLILRTLVGDGRLQQDAVSASTVRRLYRDHDLTRQTGHESDEAHQRLSWEAEAPMSLWHGDVLYGPTIDPVDREPFETRIHGMLDDASRVVVWLEAARSELEIVMVRMLADAIRRRGKPDALYLDNGSTYSGTLLETICGRLEVGLVHASPSDPQARGKMERFWRTLREGCLDHLGQLESLHDLNVRLRAFLDQHYHHAPHAGLMGRAPMAVFDEQTEEVERPGEDRLQEVFQERHERDVRRDSTLQFEGTTWEVDQRFLCSRTVQVCRPLLDDGADPWVECEGRRFEMHPVDPKRNAERSRRKPDDGDDDHDAEPVDFDPNAVNLARAAGRTPNSSNSDSQE
ncbi:MAG: helix-turn-helix domain-containing protein [Bradymonadaceae bacterium]